MSVHLAAIGNAFQFFNTNGRPLALGLLYTYAAGTSTPQTTYTDSTGIPQNTNPIVLNPDGRVPNEIWLTDAVAYKFVLQTAGGATIGTYDNIIGINDRTGLVTTAALAASSGSSLVGFLQAGTGAVLRTAQSKMRDIVSVKDFGALGDGTTDDTAAIQAALSSGAGGIYLPTATYITGTLTVPSNVTVFGDGKAASTLKAKAALNAPVMQLSNHTNICLRDFGVDGNYTALTGGDGSGITAAGASFIDVISVRVQNTQDWGFGFYEITSCSFVNCDVPTIKGGANSAAIRAGYLFGASAPGVTNASDLAVTNCFAGGAGNFTDGFVAEEGFDIRITGCRSAVSYTGFKIRTSRTIVEGCYATGGTQGYQTQQAQRYVSFIGNVAYRCGDSGFFFNNSDAANPFYGLIVEGNQAIENGQAPLSTSYGFAFEMSAGATISQVVIANNIAVDHQGVKTQNRGLSFGALGTYNYVKIGEDNIFQGNTVNYIEGALSSVGTTRGGRRVSADRGDVDVALVWTVDEPTQRFETALTANRAVTMTGTNDHNGAKYRIVRTATSIGAFNLTVAGKALATGQWADVEHNGAAWMLTAFGSL